MTAGIGHQHTHNSVQQRAVVRHRVRRWTKHMVPQQFGYLRRGLAVVVDNQLLLL